MGSVVKITALPSLQERKILVNSAQAGLGRRIGNLQREDLMPVYDYLCNDCHKEFETVLTLDEHDHTAVKCPQCGSKNVEQAAAAFFAVTSKKS